MSVQKERFVPWVGLQCVIAVFADHTHLLFVWLVQSGLSATDAKKHAIQLLTMYT